jgi:hypothetical protein
VYTRAYLHIHTHKRIYLKCASVKLALRAYYRNATARNKIRCGSRVPDTGNAGNGTRCSYMTTTLQLGLPSRPVARIPANSGHAIPRKGRKTPFRWVCNDGRLQLLQGATVITESFIMAPNEDSVFPMSLLKTFSMQALYTVCIFPGGVSNGSCHAVAAVDACFCTGSGGVRADARILL